MIYEFMATQDLHGYDEPWAPGAGTNKLPPAGSLTPVTNGNFTVTPYADGHYHLKKVADTSSRGISIDLSETITVTTSMYFTPLASIGGNGTLVCNLRTSEPLNLTSAYVGKPSSLCTNDGVASQIYLYFTAGSEWEGDLYPMITAEVATAFSPYSNICPPEGFNIWDPIEQEFIQVYAGYVNANTRELYLRPVYQEYAGEELVGPWMSSLDEYSEDATPTEGAFVIDFGGELESFEITPFMLQTLLESLGIRQHFTDGASLLNKLMDQAQGRVRSEEELLHLSRPLKVIAIGDQLPAGITFKPISKDVLPGLPGKFIR